MSVKLLVGAPAYNKAPVPTVIPSKKLFPHKLTLEGQPAWVSVPQPDKLHLTVRLKAEHFAPSFKPDDPHHYGRMVLQHLASGQAGAVLQSKYVPHANLYTQVQIDLGNLGQPVFFALSRTKKDPTGPHTLSIHLNPRLLGDEGQYEFLEQLHLVTQKQLRVGSMLADARVSRLDVAVDILGIDLGDILMSSAAGTKQRAWRGATGDIETFELFRTKKQKAGGTKLGERLAIAYDKRAERIAAGTLPTYGDCPLTRVEITKSRFGNKPVYLADLPGLANPFKQLRVGFVRSAQSPVSKNFLTYAALRRIYGSSRAACLLSLSSLKAVSFEDLLAMHPSDLIDGNLVWKGWPSALEGAGLSLMIEAANKKSDGVPFPDE